MDTEIDSRSGLGSPVAKEADEDILATRDGLLESASHNLRRPNVQRKREYKSHRAYQATYETIQSIFQSGEPIGQITAQSVTISNDDGEVPNTRRSVRPCG